MMHLSIAGFCFFVIFSVVSLYFCYATNCMLPSSFDCNLSICMFNTAQNLDVRLNLTMGTIIVYICLKSESEFTVSQSP